MSPSLPGVGVSIQVRHIGQHGIENSKVERCGGTKIHVDGSPLILFAADIKRHLILIGAVPVW